MRRVRRHGERRRSERAGASHSPKPEQPPQQPRQLGIARHRRHLVLPEIGEAPGKLVEIGLGHGPEV